MPISLSFSIVAYNRNLRRCWFSTLFVTLCKEIHFFILTIVTILDTQKHCRRISLAGIVQGVGFRPFVLRLAREMKLTGWVRSNAHGLEIETYGALLALDQFVTRLQAEAPSGARIDAILTVNKREEDCFCGTDFVIEESEQKQSEQMNTHISPDYVVCNDCLREMFDAKGRRFRYPLMHCNKCGPRFVLTKELPFDRMRTSMADFPMCNTCQAEYDNENNPRFRAESNSCPKCGPHLSLLNAEGEPILGDPISNAFALIKEGKIVAVKEAGCFHLFCDAHNSKAVDTLRDRKKRQFKPFPIMFANALSAARYVRMGIGEPGLLELKERPIILLKKRDQCDLDFPRAAHGMPWLGVTLPFSPLHYLLFHEAAGQPKESTEWLNEAQNFALVMTSANPKREPPVYENEDALIRLKGLADAFLLHDRAIVSYCDDSIARTGPGGLQIVRRSRGYVPRAIKLPHASKTILAFGSDTKNTICLTRNNEAFVSQHIGEIQNDTSQEALMRTIGKLSHFLNVEPAFVAFDPQSRFITTELAQDFAKTRGLPAIAVQHHHAHVAAILAEHQKNEIVTALALDSGAIAADGSVWGGELLKVDGADFERVSHLSPIAFFNPEKEARAPWHMASSILNALGRNDEIITRFARQTDAQKVAEKLALQIDLQQSTSMGAIQRGVAALLGIMQKALFRDQTLFLLEAAAERFGDIAALSGGWNFDDGKLNLRPLLSVLADEKNPERGSALFHATLSSALTEWVCLHAKDKSPVAISGGSLQNQVMRRQLRSKLLEAGFRVLEPLHFPPNDGALSLGQAWVAQQHLAQKI